jgi:hypothetical protein
MADDAGSWNRIAAAANRVRITLRPEPSAALAQASSRR